MATYYFSMSETDTPNTRYVVIEHNNIRLFRAYGHILAIQYIDHSYLVSMELLNRKGKTLEKFIQFVHGDAMLSTWERQLAEMKQQHNKYHFISDDDMKDTVKAILGG